MLSRQELAEILAETAVGRSALRTFEEWLVSRSWDVHEWGDAALRDAVYTLELAFTELSNGHSSATNFRVTCADLATQLAETLNSPISPASQIPPAALTKPGLEREIRPQRLGRLSSADIAGHAVPADPVRLAA